MFKLLHVLDYKDQGIVLYCRDDSLENMAWDDVKDYVSRIKKIKIYDKDLNEKECGIKKYDVMNSLSDKISIALLIDKTINNIDNNNIMVPSEITVIK